MPLYKTPAIILRSIPYGEADKIVTLYTRDCGKIKGFAKGAKRSRKRFGNSLEICSYINASFFEKENADLVRLNHCDLIRSFAGLREDIHKLAWASYLIELVNEMTAERIKNIGLFNLLIFSLKTIDHGALKEEIQRIFEVRLLSCLGYQPRLDHCPKCPRGLAGDQFFFSVREGGILCPVCAANLPGLVSLSLGTIKTLLLAQTIPLEKVGRISFSSQSLRESQVILSLFLRQYLRKELKSKKFLEEISKPFSP
jgi:DNA repair protein RecO (recombination protein O)